MGGALVPIDIDDPRWAELFASARPGHALAQPSGGRTCPHCHGTEVSLLEGNYACRGCNTLVERFLDHGAEWRTFLDEGHGGADPARCGPPPSGHVHAMGGCVVPVWRAPRSRKRETPVQQQQLRVGTSSMRVVQRYQAWNSLTHRERTLVGVFDLISVSAASFGLPSCITEQAKALYKRLYDQRILRGDSRTSLIAACLYLACKSNKVPRSTREVAEMFGVSAASLTRGCRMFDSMASVEGVKSSAPLDFVGRFSSNLGLPTAATALVRHVVARATELYVASESMPPTLVGAAIHLASNAMGMGLDRGAVAAACRVSAATIARTLRTLAARRADLLPACGVDAFLRRHGGSLPSPPPSTMARFCAESVDVAVAVAARPHECV